MSRPSWPSHLIGAKTANLILLRKPSFFVGLNGYAVGEADSAELSG